MNIARLPKATESNLWYRYTDRDAVLVFVHGVLSNSRDCWLHEDKKTKQSICYWPELIELDARFKDIGIYLAGYHTAVDSGDFPIEQCALEMFSYLKTRDFLGHPPVMEKKKIIFVCHSMGGIVARHLLCAERDAFNTKQVGIVLIASPSYGSKLARSLDEVIYLYNHRQGKQLRWGSETLKELNRSFKNLYDSRKIPNLYGVEFFENRFVFHWKWLPIFARTKVVTEESAALFFGNAKQVGGSDHFSICKPATKTDRVHQFLFEFLSEKSLLPADSAATASPSFLAGVSGTATPGALGLYPIDQLTRQQTDLPPEIRLQPTQFAGQLSYILVGQSPAGMIEGKPRIDELFEVITDPDEIPRALFRTEASSGLAPYDVDYINAREGIPDVQQGLEIALRESKGRLLVYGLGGIGKTREISELARAACATKWKILVARNEGNARLGPPLAMPPELVDAKLLIIIDNLHTRVADGADQPTPPYVERLEGLLEWLEHRLPGSVRVVATARDEPRFQPYLDLHPEKRRWRSFGLFRLPSLTDDGLRQMLTALAARTRIPLASDDVSRLIQNSDRKPATVFINVDLARQRGTALSTSAWKPTEGESWLYRFIDARAQHAGVDHVCQALHLLAKSGIPARVAYATSIARASGGKDPEAAISVLVGEGMLGMRQGIVTPFSAEQLDELLGHSKVPAVKLPDCAETLEGAMTDPEHRPPEWADDLLALSRSLARADATDRAEQVASRILELGAGGAHDYRNRAGIRFRRLDLTGAEADLTKVLEIGGEDEDTLFARGSTRMLLGDFTRALEDLDLAIKHGRDDSAVHAQRASAYYQLGQWREADAALTVSIERGNDSGMIFYTRATVRLQLKDAAGAESDFSTALERGIDLDEVANQLRNFETGAPSNAISPSAGGAAGGALMVYAMRGFARFLLGKSAGAEEDLTVAITGGVGEHFRGFTDSMKASALPMMTNVSKKLEGMRVPFGEGTLLHVRGLARLNLDKPADAECDFTEALDRGIAEGEVYWGRGSARLLMRKYAGAEQDAATALERGKDDAVTYSLRGLARLGLERFSEAEQDFDKAIELKRDDAHVFAWRGTARMKQGKRQDAELDLTASVDRQADGRTLFARGCVRFDLQKYVEAEQDLTAALDRGFNQPSLFVMRGAARLEQHQLVEADEDAAAAFARGANDIPAYSLRAAVRLAQERLADAEPDFNAAIELGRNDAWVLAGRGTARQALGRHAEAEQDYGAVIALGVNDRDLLVNRGRTRLAQKKWLDAERDFLAAINAGRDDASVHFYLAQAKKEQKHYSAANAEFDLAVARDKATVFVGPRAAFRILLGNFRGAEDDLNEIIAREPANGDILHLRGIARRAQRKFAAAMADYDAALALLPNNMGILGSRVTTNVRLGNLSEAEGDCQRLAAIDPDADETQGSHGELKLVRAEFDGAVICFGRAAQHDSAWRFEEGLAFLLLGRSEEARHAYGLAAAESPPGGILLALDQLDFYLNRYADRAASVGIQSAATLIRSELRQVFERGLEEGFQRLQQ